MNAGGEPEKLYHMIRKQVKRSFIDRRLATVDDATGDIFLLLLEQTLPPLESEEFKKLLAKTVNRLVRRIKRSDREMLDVDELNDEEHPFYETKFYSENEDFEFVFEKFCDTFPDPQRTVFRQFRILTKRDVAELLGISRNEVTRIIKSIPDLFRSFLNERSNAKRTNRGRSQLR